MPVQRYDLPRPDGGFERRYWSSSSFPILGPDDVLQFIMHRVEDVTDFLRTSAEMTAGEAAPRSEQEVATSAREVAAASRRLKEANAELARLYARAQELDDLKNQFFANVTHELRTPLMLILAPARNLLERAEPEDPVRKDATLILRNAEVLLGQVNDLLDAAKLDARAVRVDHARIDAAELLRGSTAFFESMAIDREITLRIEVPSATVAADLDHQHMQRVLVNLVSNAFKFTPSGGLVRCTLRTTAARVVFEVADSGPGIPGSERELAFERYRQVRGGSTRSVGGTGLGLSIVRDLAELHGGTVAIDSAPEGGTLVIVDLPRFAATGTTHRTGPARPATSPPAALGGIEAPVAASHRADSEHRPAVLLIEDNPDLNDLIRRALRDAYTVESAHDGDTGFKLAQAKRPALIVCDLMMPRQSGEELLYRIRAPAASGRLDRAVAELDAVMNQIQATVADLGVDLEQPQRFHPGPGTRIRDGRFARSHLRHRLRRSGRAGARRAGRYRARSTRVAALRHAPRAGGARTRCGGRRRRRPVDPGRRTLRGFGSAAGTCLCPRHAAGARTPPPDERDARVPRARSPCPDLHRRGGGITALRVRLEQALPRLEAEDGPMTLRTRTL